MTGDSINCTLDDLIVIIREAEKRGFKPTMQLSIHENGNQFAVYPPNTNYRFKIERVHEPNKQS